MISTTPNMQGLAGQLLAVLDEEVSLLTLRQAQLERLRIAILGREDSAMEKLMEEMAEVQEKQAATDVRLEKLRKSLGSLLGYNGEELQLADLVESLPGELGAAVGQRRRQIVSLLEKAKKQQLETSLLLYESSRINRLILSTLFPQSEPVVTYDQEGQNLWRSGTGLIDSEL